MCLYVDESKSHSPGPGTLVFYKVYELDPNSGEYFTPYYEAHTDDVLHPAEPTPGVDSRTTHYSPLYGEIDIIEAEAHHAFYTIAGARQLAAALGPRFDDGIKVAIFAVEVDKKDVIAYGMSQDVAFTKAVRISAEPIE